MSHAVRDMTSIASLVTVQLATASLETVQLPTASLETVQTVTGADTAGNR